MTARLHLEITRRRTIRSAPSRWRPIRHRTAMRAFEERALVESRVPRPPRNEIERTSLLRNCNRRESGRRPRQYSNGSSVFCGRRLRWTEPLPPIPSARLTSRGALALDCHHAKLTNLGNRTAADRHWQTRRFHCQVPRTQRRRQQWDLRQYHPSSATLTRSLPRPIP